MVVARRCERSSGISIYSHSHKRRSVTTGDAGGVTAAPCSLVPASPSSPNRRHPIIVPRASTQRGTGARCSAKPVAANGASSIGPFPAACRMSSTGSSLWRRCGQISGGDVQPCCVRACLSIGRNFGMQTVMVLLN